MAYATSSLVAADIGQRTPAAGIPVAWIYLVPFVGYLLTALRALMMITLVDVRQIAHRGERPA
jgi:TRAP-type C4-dicarboxylate transport system permease small subunit